MMKPMEPPTIAMSATPPTMTPMISPKWLVEPELGFDVPVVLEPDADPEAEFNLTLEGSTLAGAVGCVPI
jgi:hypothetical protein